MVIIFSDPNLNKPYVYQYVRIGILFLHDNSREGCDSESNIWSATSSFFKFMRSSSSTFCPRIYKFASEFILLTSSSPPTALSTMSPITHPLWPPVTHGVPQIEDTRKFERSASCTYHQHTKDKGWFPKEAMKRAVNEAERCKKNMESALFL